MAKRRRSGRNVQGILLLDKPLGITSNQALQQVKRLFQAQKAGHTGSLDPLADGLLPICFGGATKVSAYLLDADKRYRMRAKLGVSTTTQDAEGEVLETRPADQVTEEALRETVGRFVGNLQQVPPMYSALKHKGERLYKLAREGKEVEREPRPITIYESELIAFEPPEFELDVRCSKGTYVRTLAADIGDALGCGAHVTALTRTGVGPYAGANMVSMAQLEAALEADGPQALDAFLLPIDSALDNWPAVRMSADTAFYLGQGQPVMVPNAPVSGYVRLYDANERFVGVGEIDDDGKVAPRRLLAG